MRGHRTFTHAVAAIRSALLRGLQHRLMSHSSAFIGNSITLGTTKPHTTS